MPLTKKIIEEVVRDVVKSELTEVSTKLIRIESSLDNVENRLGDVENRLDKVENSLDKVENRLEVVENKVDKLNTTVTDFAGQVKKFDEEQTVLSDHVSNRTDRIEKLEVSVFGTTSV